MHDILDEYNLRDVFSIFPVGMPKDDDDGDEEEETNDDADNDESGDDDGDKSGSGGENSATDKPDTKRVKALSEEAKNHRLRAKKAEKDLAAAQAKLKEIEDKDKSEVEKLSGDLKEATEQVTKLSEKATKQARKLAFYDCGAAVQFRNPATALKLLDLSDVDMDDDEKDVLEAVKAKADALLKAEPYLAASGSGDEDEDDDDKVKTPNLGGKKTKKDNNVAALAKRYPALAGRQ